MPLALFSNNSPIFSGRKSSAPDSRPRFWRASFLALTFNLGSSQLFAVRSAAGRAGVAAEAADQPAPLSRETAIADPQPGN